jgi:hypothetical protein
MRNPQVIVYETDGTLAARLRERVEARGWLLRESRQHEACLNLLREVRPAVLVLKPPRHVLERPPDRLSATAAEALARKRERQLLEVLTLLDEAARLTADVPAVFVGDAPLGPLAGVAYDLGARYVVGPPATLDLLPDVVEGLMTAAIDRGAWPDA